MRINNYLEKLRSKPEHQRERIAIFATAVSFAVIFIIWIVSFNEMNKASEPSASPETQSATDNLKENLGDSSKSIQEMLEQLPSEEDLGSEESLDLEGEDIFEGSGETGQEGNMPENEGSGPSGESAIPQLP